jgi:thiosulfate/3-mercaptopyruvate sulfurtransferase
MAFTTLIDTKTLAGHLADPAFAIVDCRFNLDDESWGERNYLAGHISGAVYAHLDRDLSGTKTGTNGRHPLPSAHSLTHTLSRFGIDSGIQVVAYDQDAGMYASRFWWLLRWMGHEAAAVLDGGFATWTSEGLPTARGEESRSPRAFRGAPVAGMIVNVEEVAALAHRTDWRLVDARAPERFRGESETIDRVAGHIPGAVNHFFKRNLTEGGTFLQSEPLRAGLRQATGDVARNHIVCYCGSGVTACQNLLALEHAGLGGAKLYPGSWSEWSSDPARPIETGPQAEAARNLPIPKSTEGKKG